MLPSFARSLTPTVTILGKLTLIMLGKAKSIKNLKPLRRFQETKTLIARISMKQSQIIIW